MQHSFGGVAGRNSVPSKQRGTQHNAVLQPLIRRLKQTQKQSSDGGHAWRPTSTPLKSPNRRQLQEKKVLQSVFFKIARRLAVA